MGKTQLNKGGLACSHVSSSRTDRRMVAQAAGGSKVVQREGPWPRQSGILEKVALTWKGQGVGRADIGHTAVKGPGASAAVQ